MVSETFTNIDKWYSFVSDRDEWLKLVTFSFCFFNAESVAFINANNSICLGSSFNKNVAWKLVIFLQRCHYFIFIYLFKNLFTVDC